MKLAWVVGRGGLFGAALERTLRLSGTTLFEIAGRLPWNDMPCLYAQLRDEVARFAAAAQAFDGWEIYWAAGIGTMSSTEASLVTETEALALLCDAIRASRLVPRSGRLALASSAGAIYAGSSDAVISERSVERPTTAYARAKLVQERIVAAHAAHSGTATLAARISTLYGVGQANGKQQGLLTHISRCVLRNEPVRIFVPLDTIRDYVGADDAAAMTVDALQAVEPAMFRMKIVASERPVTISEIVAIFNRLARRRPRIITSVSPTSRIYTRRIEFRSVVAPLRSRPSTPLLIGINRLLTAERRRYVSPTDATGAAAQNS